MLRDGVHNSADTACNLWSGIKYFLIVSIIPVDRGLLPAVLSCKNSDDHVAGFFNLQHPGDIGLRKDLPRSPAIELLVSQSICKLLKSSEKLRVSELLSIELEAS